MLVEKTIEVPARTDTVTDYVQCEICGAKTANTRDWSADRYGVNEVTVSLREGSSFPEGGSITEIIVDICPDCFTSKLLPWIKAQGGKPREVTIDF